ncbi:hypothetical protein D9M71_798630 [compost metagenome]
MLKILIAGSQLYKKKKTGFILIQKEKFKKDQLQTKYLILMMELLSSDKTIKWG